MEQFERAKRYLLRIEEIYKGVPRNATYSKEKNEDDLISFFIHCYHIRDWIFHLNKIELTTKELDSYINAHLALRVCVDLANGSKHCRLKRTLRTVRQPHIAMKQYKSALWITGDVGEEIVQSKYTIMCGTELFDVLELAEECILLWAKFIQYMQNSNDKNMQNVI